MFTQTLVLTPWMAPHRVVTWETAVCLVYTGKADVLEVYDEVVRSPTTEMKIPCIIRLTKGISMVKKGAKFSRVNIMTRDHFTCQYCGVRKPMSQLNYDHVIPRSQGGQTVWENIVTACAGPHGCNSKKAGCTPAQAGMRLLKTPVKPKTLPLTGPTLNYPDAPEIWKFYLGDRTAFLVDPSPQTASNRYEDPIPPRSHARGKAHQR